MAISYMTQEGYDKKMAELNRLENVERPDVVKAIQEAREKGDLSENAEYDAAKERQGMLEAKISELKNLVATARIIDQSKLQTDEVQLMNKVTIKNIKNNAKMTYTIVSETEADLKAGKISITTPIAKGLLGHKKGDVVDVKVPAGTMKFEIIDIGL
ncbi:MAG: transcription elongation factor GreA [Sodaliphilus pleomorphus]|jgi:transcription elongation factor GreA|uniref:Transcription elongation factor GreA n=1 Tax=Sodaliphilus pleomorphus TaxID=2606626 RepID=A0A6L5XCI3_9BACT|nr:transcription elongation factor GreA [Sodaliphilus pleomorphus]MCI5981200.1 transcription elongation factor GreA [Muribaculaceae bacterium]MDY6253284.1 transcription elongation factor GreA [Bacteroidales bacterium]MCI6168903.1 transcription elongation factor GreA [Muribaculaceae bacterium]MDD6474096.1 transcription elongation factor GreA [Sodaliphilus pleomorphus]MDD6687840.1 transcription elongation factor GreA [Sodaliphilus pleomorphus]